jgi:uncharacterized iron-regulated protein
MLTLAGCAAHADGPPALSTTPKAACVAPGTWLEPASAKTLSTPEALKRLRDARVVLLGETHVIADHHRWHMQTVAQLYAQHPDMILGFEAFPRRVQAVLDRWVAGELTEAEFLKQSEWETVWRYDANLYLPLFHFARLNHIPMVALNVERALIRQVSERGWKNVPVSERRGVGDPAPASNGYIAMLGQAYGQHDNGNGNGETNDAPKAQGLDDPHFAGFVDAQLTWDRAMAEATASALQAARAQGRDPQLVAVIGSGHMDFGFGVPHQLTDLGIDKVKVLTPWDKMRPCADLRKNPPPADLVYGLAVTADDLPTESDGPKLGIMIEAADGGVQVKEVLDVSIAKTAGLLANDLITHAAGQNVATSGELVAIIKGMTPGTWLPLTVQRGGKTNEIVARFPAAKP